MYQSFSFSLAQFETLFPFFMIFNREMKIVQIGKSLAKLSPVLLEEDANSLLEISRPYCPKLDFEKAKTLSNQVVILTLNQAEPIQFRGQFLYLSEKDSLVFLGSPWFYSIEDLKKHKLVLNDFAVHDSIIDLLHILKTQEIAYNDTHTLFTTVKKQKDELTKLSLIVEESINPIIITDELGNIEWVNKSFERLTGYSLSEIKNKRPGNVLQGKDTNPETIHYLRECVRKGQPFQCEIMNYTKDKRPYWIAIMGQPIFDKNGKVINFFAIEEDITERILAQEKLKYSEEKYRSIIENMELGLMEVDNKGNVVYPYPRFCALTGYSAEELIGKNATTLLVPAEYHKILIQQSKDREEGKSGTYEIPLIHKKGHLIWLLVSGAPIYDEDGKIKGSIGIHYDLTERKNLEEKLALAKQVAEQARQTEQQFLANMSHEIRTPLNAIIGMSHLLYDTRPNREQKEYIDILNSSANFLHSLISNVLDMAKIEAGKIEVNSRPFDLVGMVSALQKTFQMKLEGRPIEVEAMIDSRIKGFYIGDETMLHQILMNILGNADKFTEEGSIGISIRQTKKETNKIWVEFKVYDTGIGIEAAQLPFIFQKFKQIQDVKGQKYKGTGLGLSIVKELIDVQGGIISVESVKNEGTTFSFILPFEKVSEDYVEANTENMLENMPNFSGAFILMVEDNIMNRKYLGSLLDKQKIRWEVAVDGLEAVRKAGVQKYDLILMDIQMPNMNGYEATLNIRNTQNINRETPIIALTASAMIDQKNKAFEVGMNDYLSKPFTPQQLFDKIAAHLHFAPNNCTTPDESTTKAHFQYDIRLDTTYLQTLYGNDYAYAFSMFETFISDILPEFEKLLTFANTHQIVELRRLVHQIKPTTAMVGLTSLEKDLLILETYLDEEKVEFENMIESVRNIYAFMQAQKETIFHQHKVLKQFIP